MSTYSPPNFDAKHDLFDMPSAASSSRPAGTHEGGAGLSWTPGGAMLRLENGVEETIVTQVTRKVTTFAPIQLPRIAEPEHIARPDHLSPEHYPLAQAPTPEDMRLFPLTVGGRRVMVQDDNTIATESVNNGENSGPGWVKSYPPGFDPLKHSERVNLVQALARTTAREKEMRKRPHDSSRPDSRTGPVAEAPTPPVGNLETPSHSRQRRSPPRKKIRGLDDITLPHDGLLLSPLPSPDHEGGPASAASSSAQPISAPGGGLGSGTELATLFSLPAIVGHFEAIPDKLQQQVLMHLLRRSRMATIQRTYAFAGMALKRDFISHLPHEIAVQILKKVDTPTLAAAMRVSKKWKKMIDTERAVWRQRLVDEDLWYGMGVEAEDEKKLARRMEAVELRNRLNWKPSRAGTPNEDEPMTSTSTSSSVSANEPAVDRPIPLKHVFRRRHTSVRNWLETKPTHTSFAGHGTNVVTCLQFDDEKIVSASDDHSINIYNTNDGQLRKRLDGHEGGVWALEYKGDTLVTGSTDRTVRIWDLDALAEAHVFHGHTSTVRCLQIVEPVLDEATGEFFPAYPMLVTGSRDTTLRVWKLPKKGEPPVPPSLDEAGNEIQVSPDQNPWHVHLLEGHTQAVRSLAAHGRICISGSYDSTVKVWDIVTGTLKHTLTGHDQKVYSITYDRHRNRCASGSMDNTVKVWDVGTGECLHTLTGHTSLVGLLGVSANFIVSAAADASLRIWDADDHQLKHTLASHGGAITCFKHDETKVVSGADGTLKLWDIRTGRYIRDLVIGISSVWQVGFHGNLLVAASNRNGSTVYDVFRFESSSTPHPSGIDDDSLDRPDWERKDPMEPPEPPEYQMRDALESIDGVEMTSPIDPLNCFASPNTAERFRRETSSIGPRAGTGGGAAVGPSSGGSRRSRRLAAKDQQPGLPDVPPPRSRRGTRGFGRDEYGTSPSPAGPSRAAGSNEAAWGSRSGFEGDEEETDDAAVGRSFGPRFDEEGDVEPVSYEQRGEDDLMDEDITGDGVDFFAAR